MAFHLLVASCLGPAPAWRLQDGRGSAAYRVVRAERIFLASGAARALAGGWASSTRVRHAAAITGGAQMLSLGATAVDPSFYGLKALAGECAAAGYLRRDARPNAAFRRRVRA